MSNYPTEQEIAMVQQDPMAYSEPLLRPYVQDISNNQLAHPSIPTMSYAAGTSQLSNEDWWLWSNFPQLDSDLVSQQTPFYGLASQEAAVSSNPYDCIEMLSKKITELERKLLKLDELERRCNQLEVAEQRLAQIEEMQHRLCQVELSIENHYIKYVAPAYMCHSH
jgi:hypothetical protein